MRRTKSSSFLLICGLTFFLIQGVASVAVDEPADFLNSPTNIFAPASLIPIRVMKLPSRYAVVIHLVRTSTWSNFPLRWIGILASAVEGSCAPPAPGVDNLPSASIRAENRVPIMGTLVNKGTHT